jgi:hypothetical protein
MRFHQIREVLDWTRAFHHSLAEQYGQLAHSEVKERAALLLDYLKDHELALEKAVERYESTAMDGVMNTWFDHNYDSSLPETLEEWKSCLRCVETEEIVRTAITFHDKLIELYRELRDQASTPSVKELFADLAQMEHNEKLRMVRDATRLEDY